MESVNKSEHLSTGIRGEEIAADYLAGLGYLILEKNWCFVHRELDIIAVDGDELVIVEVKTRREPVLAEPEKAVNRKKQWNIISAANVYVRYNRINLDVRFDVIWITFDRSGKPVIEHIPDAFIPVL